MRGWFRKNKPRIEPVDLAIAEVIAAADQAGQVAADVAVSSDATQLTADEAADLALSMLDRPVPLDGEPLLSASRDDSFYNGQAQLAAPAESEASAECQELEKSADVMTRDNISQATVTGDKSRPRQLFIGYYAHIKRKDLLQFLRAYALSHCEAPKVARYQIRKYEQGFVYELHDGGSAGGVLSSVIKALETERSVLIDTAGRKVMVVRDQNGITSFLLNEDDATTPTPSVTYRDPMKQLTRVGLGLFVMGVVTFILGFSVFTTGAITKQVAVEGARRPNFKVAEKEIPADGLKQLAKHPATPGFYIGKIAYENGTWQVSRKPEGQLPPPPPEAMQATEEMRDMLDKGESAK